MTSGASERTSRLRRRYERLAAGADEDERMVNDLLAEIVEKYAAITAVQSDIDVLRERVRKHRSMRQARIDEMRHIQGMLHQDDDV